MVLKSIWPRNHTSHKKFYFYEFVANVLRDNIGIAIFEIQGHGGCWRPKGGNFLKKAFNKSFSTTSKTPLWVQSDLSYCLHHFTY